MKRDGVWLKPLKFLGLEYDGNTQELYAATRNGSKLRLNEKADLIKAILERDTTGYQESASRLS